jgi:hypothetical protein
LLHSTSVCFSTTSDFAPYQTEQLYHHEYITNLIRVFAAGRYDLIHKENSMAVTDTWFVTGSDEETDEFIIDQPPALVPIVLDVRCPDCGEFLRQGQLDTEPPVPFTFCKNDCDLRGYAF